MDFAKQFGRPRGLLGLLAGQAMAVENRPLNEWAIELLDLHPDEDVLEIGCGPGIALRTSLERVTAGRVAGIDPSPAMLWQARWRNRRALASGRLELRRAVAESLPWAPASFDKVLSVRGIHEWRDPARAVAEIHRVLRPTGLVVLATRAQTRTEFAAEGRRLVDLLCSAGFEAVRIVRKRPEGRLRRTVRSSVGLAATARKAGTD